MKLIALTVDGKSLEVNRTLLGSETVYLDGNLVSKKQTLFGTTHTIEVNNKKYDLKYRVKNPWKSFVGKPIFQINSEGVLISENHIENRTFLSIQLLIGFIFTFCCYLILEMIINSAKNGFVFYAH